MNNMKLTDTIYDLLLSIKLQQQETKEYCSICKHNVEGASSIYYSCEADTIFLCPVVQKEVNIIQGYLQGAQPMSDLYWLKEDL